RRSARTTGSSTTRSGSRPTTTSSPFYGRTYVTWTAYLSASGVALESPIWEAHSNDGGYTWTAPKEISGSNSSLCTFQVDGPAGQCDEDQFSSITIGRDGTVY